MSITHDRIRLIADAMIAAGGPASLDDRPVIDWDRTGEPGYWASEAVDDGWYLIYPDGGAWVAVQMRAGRMVGLVEESDADTHRAASDSRAWIADAVEAIDDDADQVDPITAHVVVEAWSPESIADQCRVYQIAPRH